MNLKEKAIEAREYGEIKTELIGLINNFLAQYKEYESIYKDIFEKWVDKLISEFETVFKSEGFVVTTEIKHYSEIHSTYNTIKAELYDLEFKLSITMKEYQQIRFLQTKPEIEEKNIVIKPSVKQYYMNSIVLKNEELEPYKTKEVKISSIGQLKEVNEKVKNAQFSVNTMNEFILAIKRESHLLLEELDNVKEIYIKSIATPAGKFGGEDKDASYGEFENFSELIEKI